MVGEVEQDNKHSICSVNVAMKGRLNATIGDPTPPADSTHRYRNPPGHAEVALHVGFAKQRATRVVRLNMSLMTKRRYKEET